MIIRIVKFLKQGTMLTGFDGNELTDAQQGYEKDEEYEEEIQRFGLGVPVGSHAHGTAPEHSLTWLAQKGLNSKFGGLKPRGGAGGGAERQRKRTRRRKNRKRLTRKR